MGRLVAGERSAGSGMPGSVRVSLGPRHGGAGQLGDGPFYGRDAAREYRYRARLAGSFPSGHQADGDRFTAPVAMMEVPGEGNCLGEPPPLPKDRTGRVEKISSSGSITN